MSTIGVVEPPVTGNSGVEVGAAGVVVVGDVAPGGSTCTAVLVVDG